MNRFLLLTVILLSTNLITSYTTDANAALIKAEIFQEIAPQRRLNIPGLQRSYSWEFENKFYTAIMVIDEQWYNRIRNQLQKRRRDHRHFPPMVYKGVTSLEELIREFDRVIPQTWSEERKVNFVLSFVQAIPYKKDETTGYDEFYKFATETLAEGQGDCEDTSILFAAILSGLGFQSALLDLPGHLAVGVKGDFKGWYVPYKNDKYFFCETASDNTRVKMGMMSERYEKVSVRIMPITPNPVQPKLVVPQTLPPRTKLPSPPSSQRSFENGKNLYYSARYNEAIKSLQLALSGLSKSEQQAQIYIYLAAAELGFGESISKVKGRFQKALQQNPVQELPWPDHQKFMPLFEEVRNESIGELTVSASLPRTEIWIDGNEINRKKVGIGTSRINLKLFKGNYTVEGIYAETSIKQTINIKPNSHSELQIEIPPIVKHLPVSEVSVGEIVPLTLNLTSLKKPNQIKIYYTVYDDNNKEVERNNKKMLLSRRQPELSIWIYDVNLPLQRSAGLIRYHIEVEYGGRLLVRNPKSPNRYHQISVIDDTPPPVNPPPKIVLIDPVQSSMVNQQVSIKAKVTDDKSVKSVYLYYGFSRSRFREPSKYYMKILTSNALDIYTGRILSQNDVGYIWYYLIATDGEGNQNKSDKRLFEIKPHRPDPPRTPNQPPRIVLQNPISTSEVNQRIPITAKVTDDESVKSVYFYYGFSRSKYSEPSEYYVRILKKDALDLYTGYISRQNQLGYVWYYLTAIDSDGKKSESDKEIIEIRKRRPYPAPKEQKELAITVVNEPIVRQEIWTDYAWVYRDFGENATDYDWNRRNTISLTYIREGKSNHLFGFQLDYSYQNPLNMGANFQWGPNLGESPIRLIFQGGVTRYNNSNETIYITPILGAGVSYYPVESVAVEVKGTLKIPSDSDTTYLYHIEIGSRFYITDALNLKIGYGQWYLGDTNSKWMQVGLGITF